MSLPWFQLDTDKVLTDRDLRILEGRKASDTEGAAEIGALLAAGRLPSMSQQGLASTLGWTRKKVARLIRDWEINAGDQPWGSFGAAEGQRRGSEGAAPPEEKQEDTTAKGQLWGSEGAAKGHRARVPLKEKEGERESKRAKAAPTKAETAWAESIWPTVCKASGRNPNTNKLKTTRVAMLVECAKVAAGFGDDGRATLVAYLEAIPEVPGLEWLYRKSPSVESFIKPTLVHKYLEEWHHWASTPKAREIDSEAVIRELRHAALYYKWEDISEDLRAALEASGGKSAYRKADQFNARRIEKAIIAHLKGAA